MDGVKTTVERILLRMLDEVGTEYRITDEALTRYAKMVRAAVEETEGRTDD